MNRHNHTECEHEQLAYCKRCQVVYCKDCNKEWKELTYIIDATKSVPTWTYPGIITYTGNIIVSCNHMSLDEQK